MSWPWGLPNSTCLACPPSFSLLRSTHPSTYSLSRWCRRPHTSRQTPMGAGLRPRDLAEGCRDARLDARLHWGRSGFGHRPAGSGYPFSGTSRSCPGRSPPHVLYPRQTPKGIASGPLLGRMHLCHPKRWSGFIFHDDVKSVNPTYGSPFTLCPLLLNPDWGYFCQPYVFTPVTTLPFPSATA